MLRRDGRIVEDDVRARGGPDDGADRRKVELRSRRRAFDDPDPATRSRRIRDDGIRDALQHLGAMLTATVDGRLRYHPEVPRGFPSSGQLPTCVGRFEVMGVLGRGGSGSVLEARDGAQIVAVKVLRSGKAVSEKESARLLAEAE